MLENGTPTLIKRLIKPSIMAVCSHAPVRRFICWRFPRRNRRVALTFDDGPHPEYTPRILDILREHGIRATFFVLGWRVEKHPEVIRRMVAEGHGVGIHGYRHNGVNMGQQTLRTFDILSRFGVVPTLFRPPHGVLPPRAGLWMLHRGFSVVFWSIDARDSLRHQGKESAPTLFDRIAAGDIVLLHDDNPVSVLDLREILGILERKQLDTALVSELLVMA